MTQHCQFLNMLCRKSLAYMNIQKNIVAFIVVKSWKQPKCPAIGYNWIFYLYPYISIYLHVCLCIIIFLYKYLKEWEI